MATALWGRQVTQDVLRVRLLNYVIYCLAVALGEHFIVTSFMFHIAMASPRFAFVAMRASVSVV